MTAAQNSVIPTGVRPSSRQSSEVEEPAVSRLIRSLAPIVMVAMLSALAAAQELPPGWRRANTVEKSSPWRKKSQSRFFRVQGDFDGDGKTDTAELLISSTDKKFAVFVNLASTQKWQMLGEPVDLGSLDRFAIDFVKPGKYETACGKGYDDSFCAHGEPDYLILSHPAIDFIYTESADSIFYWDERTNKFREIAMGD
jgi:hypothetical protein